ncbi:hypothetical protein AMK22_09745 [Streptomyces sp. CB01580]|nr:hypothetical protein AMK22_09745 [Streptomyces sp. CB01580]
MSVCRCGVSAPARPIGPPAPPFSAPRTKPVPPGVKGRALVRPDVCERPPTTPPASPARRRPPVIPFCPPTTPLPAPMPCPIGARPDWVPSLPITVPRGRPTAGRPAACEAGRPPTMPSPPGSRPVGPVTGPTLPVEGAGGRTPLSVRPLLVVGETGPVRTTGGVPPSTGVRSAGPPLDGLSGGADGVDGGSGSTATLSISMSTGRWAE